MTLFLNGYPVEFSGAKFTACVGDLPDPKQLKELRNELGTEWFTHWRAGKVYAIPNVAQPAIQYGTPTSLECADHDNLHVLTARITARLPSCFPQYEAFSQRPFAFLGRKDEFVSKITETWKNVPPLLKHFEIRPRFELDPRIIELRDGETTIALFLAVSTRWHCFAPLQDLDKAGIDLAGLHVIRREPVPGQRRLVGRIQSVDGEVVTFSEAYDDSMTIPTGDVWLEGSRASFKRCLSKLLGSRFKEFEGFRDAEQGGLLTGPGLSELLDRMQQVLVKASPIQLSDDLSCTISDRLRLENRDDYQTVIPLTPAEYCYDPARSKRASYAWAGLERFGPYDRESFAKRTPRVLVVCPDRAIGQVGQALKAFRDGISTVRNSAYEKGFARTFHLVNPEFVTVQVPLLQDRHAYPHQAYRKALEDHLARDSSYDVALTIILDDHSRLPDETNPYLHSKAVLLTNGIPVQEAKLTTMTNQAFSLQYIFQNMAVAMYAKMGGLPWTVDHGLTVDDEIVIGMGTAELSGSRFEQRQRHIGITTVFRGDGNYLLSNLTRECSYDQYPAVLRDSTVDVLKEIRTRNAWRKGDTIRVVFHAFKPLKDVEVADIVRSCVEEVGTEQNIEFAFLTVSFDHPFKVFDTSQKGIRPKKRDAPLKAVLVPPRGLMTQLGRYTRLLCGNGPTLVKRPTSPLPTPLLVHLHKESTYRDLAYLTDQVLKFTALSWRSVLPAERPVTIYYSELIAGLLARLQAVSGWSPMVLNTKLRTSKWFL
jgi:hypothetical protein